MNFFGCWHECCDPFMITETHRLQKNAVTKR